MLTHEILSRVIRISIISGERSCERSVGVITELTKRPLNRREYEVRA